MQQAGLKFEMKILKLFGWSEVSAMLEYVSKIYFSEVRPDWKLDVFLYDGVSEEREFVGYQNEHNGICSWKKDKRLFPAPSLTLISKDIKCSFSSGEFLQKHKIWQKPSGQPKKESFANLEDKLVPFRKSLTRTKEKKLWLEVRIWSVGSRRRGKIGRIAFGIVVSDSRGSDDCDNDNEQIGAVIGRAIWLICIKRTVVIVHDLGSVLLCLRGRHAHFCLQVARVKSTFQVELKWNGLELLAKLRLSISRKDDSELIIVWQGKCTDPVKTFQTRLFEDGNHDGWSQKVPNRGLELGNF